SEEVIGRLPRSFARREEIVLATKVGNPMGQGPNPRGFSRKHLNEAVNSIPAKVADRLYRSLSNPYLGPFHAYRGDGRCAGRVGARRQSPLPRHHGYAHLAAWQGLLLRELQRALALHLLKRSKESLRHAGSPRPRWRLPGRCHGLA